MFKKPLDFISNNILGKRIIQYGRKINKDFLLKTEGN